MELVTTIIVQVSWQQINFYCPLYRHMLKIQLKMVGCRQTITVKRMQLQLKLSMYVQITHAFMHEHITHHAHGYDSRLFQMRSITFAINGILPEFVTSKYVHSIAQRQHSAHIYSTREFKQRLSCFRATEN